LCAQEVGWEHRIAAALALEALERPVAEARALPLGVLEQPVAEPAVPPPVTAALAWELSAPQVVPLEKFAH
jgi:hypothetical protein